MSAKTVTIYIWPDCQICIECAFGLAGHDDEDGLLSGISGQPYAICCKSVLRKDGARCESFSQKYSEEDS